MHPNFRDRTLGDLVIDRMRAEFQNSTFDEVWFIESIDDRDAFRANLHVYPIKSMELPVKSPIGNGSA